MSDPSPDGRLLPGSWACALPGCEVCLARGHINDTEALAIYRAECKRLRDGIRDICDRWMDHSKPPMGNRLVDLLAGDPDF